MKVAVIYGSNRSERAGIKAAKFLVNKLNEKNIEATLVDSLEFNLPFLDKTYSEYPKGEAPENLERVHEILDEADGFIIVSAEYNHSLPAALKNLLDHFIKEYRYKPSGLVTYSSGPFVGSRVGSHLRDITSNLGTPSIPTVFAISKIEDSIDENGNAIDKNYDRRIVNFLNEFEWNLEALKNQREKRLPQ
jgi:NAD(P)H-dependent FMN reductase